MVKKTVVFYCIGAVIGLYTTFVLQQLWNWFVTEAFHFSQISFWVMYGIVLIIGMFSYNPKLEEQQQFKALATGLDACVPDERRESVNEQIKEQTDQIWVDAGFHVFGKVVSNTISLALGWAVHAFLVT